MDAASAFAAAAPERNAEALARPESEYCGECGGLAGLPPRGGRDASCAGAHDITTAPAREWRNHKMSPVMLEHLNDAVNMAFGRGPVQSDALRFGYCAGAVITMTDLLECIWDVTFYSDVTVAIADARSLAGCRTTDQIAAWLVSHGKAPAGDVAAVRAQGWSHGIGALSGYVYQFAHMLRSVTGQQES